MGAELRTRVEVTELRIDGGVRATLSDGSHVTAPRAVVAASAWLATSPALRGSRAPCRSPSSARSSSGSPTLPVSRSLAGFIYFVEGRAFYGIPTADAVKVCAHHGGEPTTPDALDRTLRPEDEKTVRDYLRAHLPSVDAAPIRSRVCMYTNTPDQHFVVGRAPGRPEVVVLGGFSGHGYKAASVVGEIAAELVAEGKSALDLAMFDPARFAPVD